MSEKKRKEKTNKDTEKKKESVLINNENLQKNKTYK